MPILRTYVINLDRDTGRLEHMKNELQQVGLSFERFPAVYGLAVPERVKPFLFHPNGQQASRMTPGEIGCYASHVSVIQHFLDDSNADVALIFEDDCRLVPNFSDIVQSTLAALPADWHIVRLSNKPKKPYLAHKKVADGFDLAQYMRIPNIAAAYLLSRSGAEQFLAMKTPRREPVDEDMRRPWLCGLKTWGVIPPPAVSNLFDSSIDALGDRGLQYGFHIGKLFKKRRDNPITAVKRLAWTITDLGIAGWWACLCRDAANVFKRKLSKNATEAEVVNRYRVIATKQRQTAPSHAFDHEVSQVSELSPP